MTLPALKRRTWLGAALLLGGTGPQAQAPDKPRPLLVAVPPFLSPSAALTAFRPLRTHLESQLKQAVELYTARDFRELVEQARRGEHDVTLLPAHLAGLALSDWGFQALAATVEATPVLILLRQGSPIRTAAELRGKRLGTLGTLSLSAAVAGLWLRQQQLEPGRDLTIITQASTSSAVISLEQGDVEAIAVTRTQLNLLPPGSPGGQFTLVELSDIPAPIYIARPSMTPAELARLRKAWHSFVPDAAAPPSVVNARVHEVGRADLQRAARYRDVARQQLETAGLNPR
nr:PhnD/SsuA/transferrin family substrate-binding protein [uncultured Roseateles sp.]